MKTEIENLKTICYPRSKAEKKRLNKHWQDLFWHTLKNVVIIKARQLDYDKFTAWFVTSFVVPYPKEFMQECLEHFGYKGKPHIDRIYKYLRTL